MITNDETACPKCGGNLKYYDKVFRIVRTKRRLTKHVELRRFKCCKCGSVHREIPNYILPYKQYETELIQGVLEGLITANTIGYEDYPCEKTMIMWQKLYSPTLFLQTSDFNLE